MKRKKEKRKPESLALTRRDFLKGAGVTVSGGIIAASGATTAEAAPSAAGVVGPGPVPITLKVNGKIHKLQLEPRVSLLDAMRDHLDITGAKKVCDRATCGACTMMIDRHPVYSCTVLAIEAQGHEITTIEGLAKPGELSHVMEAFWKNDGQQCGFCTPGFVMACTAFLEKFPNPTREEVEKGLGGNLCRCGTYMGVRQAALDAVKAMKGGHANG